MALRPRQIKFYKDRCSIYRKNVAHGANHALTYSLLASGVVCKHYTSRNMDSALIGFAQQNQDDIFTSDQLHMDLIQDIGAEDMVLMTTGPSIGTAAWFRVAGDPQQRGGVANRTEVYLKPTAAPKVV